MANKHETLTDLFTATANAIREKTGSTDAIVADDFPTKIAEISTGYSVKSITTSGSYDSATYHGSYWAAIDADGYLLLVVVGGTSTAYESIYFTNGTIPSGVALVKQSYYSYSSTTASMAYVAVYSGVTADVDVALNFSGVNSSSDYVTCTVTIT